MIGSDFVLKFLMVFKKHTIMRLPCVLIFSGTPTLEKVGIKRISISFENKGEMNIGYSATVNLSVISLTVNGDFDLEELITSCSGLLCSAARALKGRNRAYEAELESIMGR
jgi:hypothetical protein